MSTLLWTFALALAFAQDPAPPDPSAAPEPGADPAAEGGGLPPREQLIADYIAQGATPEEAAGFADKTLHLLEIDAGLNRQSGVQVVAGGLVQLNIPPEYAYLGPDDAEKVLVAWGNPPGDGGEGMILPADVGPFTESSWAVLLHYEEDGHVSDDEAAEIDYDELLTDMKATVREESEVRTAAGYGALELLGWAEPPHYDAQARRLYWAKRLQFADSEGETLNYDVRLLGRRGVFSMSAIAAQAQLEQVRAGMPQILTFAEFTEGNRYTDFNPDIDQVAAYGIGALVAGKLAAKTGLLKGLLGLLLASKKLIPVVLIGAWAALKGLFSRGSRTDDPAP